MVIARIALGFELAFAEGEDGRGVNEESKDTFTLTLPKMFGKFTPRGDEKGMEVGNEVGN